MARARAWAALSPRLEPAVTLPLRGIAPVMMAMLSSREVLPPPCGPISAMARGVAFILVDFSLDVSWDMRASACENQWASGGPRVARERPSRWEMLAPLGGQCKP